MKLTPRTVAATAAFVAAVSITTSTQAPRADVRLEAGHGPWNTAAADIDGDGEMELIMATLDGGKFQELTFKTPVYIFSVTGNKVVNRSSELLESPALSWNSTITTGDFDANGATDFLLCDRGRNVGPNPPPGDVLVDGVRGAQNEVFLNRDGKLRRTDGFPRMVTSSWGCSAGDVDRSGRATIAITSFYSGKGHDLAFQLTWDGASRFIQTRTLPAPTNTGTGWGASGTADFDGNGFADVSGGQQVFWNGTGGAFTGSQPLAPSLSEKEGFSFWRTTVTADFTGDGLPDLVKVNSFPSPNGATSGPGVAFALYRGDRRLGLVEKVDGFPATATYGDEFNSQVIAIDLNFDGALDIATLGPTFHHSKQPTAAWINDGSGRFRLARWSDPIQSTVNCTGSEVYFMPTSDPKKYNIIYGGCAGLGYVGRAVTESRPLALTP